MVDLFDANNLCNKPWTPDEFTTFRHGNQRLKDETNEDTRTINSKYYILMQEQKLLVEAYCVYIEQCIKKMDHYTLSLLVCGTQWTQYGDGLCYVDNLIM